MPDKPTSTDLEVIDTTAKSITEWTPAFVTTVKDAVALAQQKRDYLKQVMVEGTHYGKIPGTDKDVLFLAGAQTLSSNMALHPVFGDAAPAIEDWTGDEHPTAPDGGGEVTFEPFLAYRRYCELRRQTGPGPNDYMVVARAEGSCNSWESKYRYRSASRKCPQCGKTGFLFKSKPPRKGFFCWSKPEAGKNGCGANFKEDDPKIINQQVGRMRNPDVLDQANTILKMADKRAYVAATLQATGCADLFTQDLEDGQGSEDIPEEVPESTEKPSPSTKTPETPSTVASSASPSPPTANSAQPSPTSTPQPSTTSTVSPTSAAPKPTPTAVTAPAGTSTPNLEPAEIGEVVTDLENLGRLRRHALDVAIEAQRLAAEAKYPGQTFTPHQLEAVARRSMEKWLAREQRAAKTFAEATEQDLRDIIEAVEKTLKSAA